MWFYGFIAGIKELSPMYEMITHVLVTLLEFWADTFGIQAHQSVFLTTLNQVFKFGSSNLQF